MTSVYCGKTADNDRGVIPKTRSLDGVQIPRGNGTNFWEMGRRNVTVTHGENAASAVQNNHPGDAASSQIRILGFLVELAFDFGSTDAVVASHQNKIPRERKRQPTVGLDSLVGLGRIRLRPRHAT